MYILNEGIHPYGISSVLMYDIASEGGILNSITYGIDAFFTNQEHWEKYRKPAIVEHLNHLQV